MLFIEDSLCDSQFDTQWDLAGGRARILFVAIPSETCVSHDGLEYWAFSRGSPDRDEASFLLRHERARGTLRSGAPFALSIGVGQARRQIARTGVGPLARTSL